jgi:hypothetical protein
VGKAEGAGKGREGLTEAPRRSEPWRIIYDPPLEESEREIGELINRHRRRVVLHSFLYYRMYQSTISDYDFDWISKDLVRLQREHSHIAEKVTFYRDYFQDWDGSSGYDLPYDPYIEAKAHQHLRVWRERNPSMLVDNTPEQQYNRDSQPTCNGGNTKCPQQT